MFQPSESLGRRTRTAEDATDAAAFCLFFLYQLKTGFQLCVPYLRPQREESFQEPRAQCNQLNLTGGAARRASKCDSVEKNDKTAVNRVERTFSGRTALGV